MISMITIEATSAEDKVNVWLWDFVDDLIYPSHSLRMKCVLHPRWHNVGLAKFLSPARLFFKGIIFYENKHSILRKNIDTFKYRAPMWCYPQTLENLAGFFPFLYITSKWILEFGGMKFTIFDLKYHGFFSSGLNFAGFFKKSSV